MPLVVCSRFAITTPTLVIAGSADTVTGNLLVDQYLAEHIPSAKFKTVNGSAHMLFWEAPTSLSITGKVPALPARRTAVKTGSETMNIAPGPVAIRGTLFRTLQAISRQKLAISFKR